MRLKEKSCNDFSPYVILGQTSAKGVQFFEIQNTFSL
jgi:hypothetical protein